MAENQPTQTANQRALTLPDIVSQIFIWIMIDHEKYQSNLSSYYTATNMAWMSCVPKCSGRFMVWADHGTRHFPYYEHHVGVLQDYAMVNRTWLAEALRLLWRDPTSYCRTLEQSLIPIDPARRQLYAQYIQSAILVTVDREDARFSNAVLRDLEFPRLKALKLLVRGYWDGSLLYSHRNGVHIPRFQSDSLALLIVDRFLKDEFKSANLMGLPYEWNAFLRRIAVQFPNLEDVRFEPQLDVDLTSMCRFEERLPNLRSLTYLNKTVTLR
ncbi:hypothetical protein NUU61_004146 [Penicillium alfredii]|uniref:Uncharacterized protein n=1 Tax=Penicillium alfredii TaxID=1506179 RepID=A0A9W9KD28_9EURO|nr:uncharacterized protein NUU61_004146 [Penicillium alfredii]KAJ5101924.1 hypothetical protein NUU61_004146 [Penicillium alfredii]